MKAASVYRENYLDKIFAKQKQSIWYKTTK